MLERKRTEPSAERRAVSFRAVFATGIAALLAAAFGAWFIYRQLIHYEPRAARHLLPGAELALRLDVEQVVLFDPVRRHLLPLVNAPMAGSARGEQRTRALREVAGLNLGRDLREIVVARGSSGAWTVALGGLFPEHGIVSGIERVLRQEGAHTPERLGDVLLLSADGIAIGQANDGVLIVASSRAALEGALPDNHVHEQVRLPLDGEAALTISAGELQRRLGPAPLPPALRDSGGLRARLRLERPLRIEVWLENANVEATRELLATLQAFTSFEVRQPAHIPAADWGAERSLLARAQVDGDAGKPPIIFTFMELAELDEGLSWVANRIERQLVAPGSED